MCNLSQTQKTKGENVRLEAVQFRSTKGCLIRLFSPVCNPPKTQNIRGLMYDWKERALQLLTSYLQLLTSYFRQYVFFLRLKNKGIESVTTDNTLQKQEMLSQWSYFRLYAIYLNLKNKRGKSNKRQRPLEAQYSLSLTYFHLYLIFHRVKTKRGGPMTRNKASYKYKALSLLHT